ncbi:putative acyltransferase, WS/DGAT/MGAT protein [Toxoplasma gondii RUB]|uniref:Putative acyltransferase, WS/DGAT/MGAT protein n=1 Tax=Toxoplasma gondii RUB TaxID=935652 RepID=A0A086LLV2_TOXGO|nr:putative acyltransferase, WS/DGAT/MGAT protein [Toxoplasma gondii RUB]
MALEKSSLCEPSKREASTSFVFLTFLRRLFSIALFRPTTELFLYILDSIIILVVFTYHSVLFTFWLFCSLFKRRKRTSRTTNCVDDASADDDSVLSDDGGSNVDSEDEFRQDVPSVSALPRRMSFPSSNLAGVPFPEATGCRHQMITIAMYCNELPSREALIHICRKHLLKYFRFRAIPVVGRWSSVWREVPVDLSWHIRSASVADDAALHAWLEDVMVKGYSSDHPRWEVHLVENRSCSSGTSVIATGKGEATREGGTGRDSRCPKQTGKKGGDGETATSHHANLIPSRHLIAFRVDHSIGDGVSLVQAASKVVTDAEGVPLYMRGAVDAFRKNNAAETRFRSPISYLVYKIRMGISRWTTRWRRSDESGTPRPERHQTLREFAHFIYAVIYSLKGPLRAFDAETPVSRPHSFRKEFGPRWNGKSKLAKAPPISLAFVKAIRQASGVPLNDVFLAAFAGAIRRYCAALEFHDFEQGDANRPRTLKALLACAFARSLQACDDPELALRNRFVLTSIELAVAQATPKERLEATHKITQWMKKSKQPLVDFACQNILGGYIVPTGMRKQIAADLFNNHSFVFANVPAYPEHFYVAGVRIEDIQVAFVNLLTQVEILSYANRVAFSMVYDPDVIKQADLLPQFFVEELFALAKDFEVPVPVEDAALANFARQS